MNSSPRRQQTIGRAVGVAGYGYWSGRDVHVEFRPAPPDTGLVFVRGDLSPAARIPALCQYRVETPRRTTLSCGGAAVEMVEHVLAALSGLQIDNCEIWVDRPELPGCDGSSAAFVEALDAAGTVEQSVNRSRLVVREHVRVGNDESWVEAWPTTDAVWSLNYKLDYGAKSAIGRQTIQLQVTPESFRRELAPARTFILQEEAEWLRSRGLGSRVTAQDLLVFDENGPVDNTLRFADECVRHKALDLVGDLALAGCDLVGSVVAYRSGHRLNAELVKSLLAEGARMSDRRRSA